MNVERRPGEMPRIQRGVERIGVNYTSARRINKDRAALHSCDALGGDEVPGRAGERAMKRDGIGVGKEPPR